jgi:glycosyltransferase involved in cell wall biosynthesis
MIEKGYCTRDKGKVIGQGSTGGIDTHHFDAQLPEILALREHTRSALGLKAESFVYCFIGRIVGDKGINELVTAFCDLYEKNSNVILLMVGPFETDLDPLSDRIRSVITQHNAIRWLDFQSDIRIYLAISDVFVFPSYREGFPNVVMQAGAMGLPCIVSNINGCNEIIEHEVNGLIIPVKNIPALYQAMEILLINTSKRLAMAEVCRSMIQDRYESVRLMELLLSEYCELIDKNKIKNP